MEKSWKITLSDGTEFENLGLSGNYYISQKEITEKDFLGKLSNVVIENTENNTSQEYGQMELIKILKYEDGYYFALRELTQQELDNIKLQSNIDYIAIMSNIDLEEGDLA